MAGLATRHQSISVPALLRSARTVYGLTMRTALDEAGYGDVPRNGLFIIGGLALEANAAPLSRLIDDLQISKQSAGQLVDTLVTRGYLERDVDPEDRRRLVITLTDRGRDAARVQSEARQRVDDALANRVGENGVAALRKVLAALSALKGGGSPTQAPQLRLMATVPILFTRDVVQAASYYEKKLGFRTDFLHGKPPFYAAISRGHARLHLRFVKNPNFAELAKIENSLILATVEVSDVHTLYDDLASRGAEIVQALENQPWGGMDFQVRDPDGNRISFVEHRTPSQDISEQEG